MNTYINGRVLAETSLQVGLISDDVVAQTTMKLNTGQFFRVYAVGNTMFETGDEVTVDTGSKYAGCSGQVVKVCKVYVWCLLTTKKGLRIDEQRKVHKKYLTVVHAEPADDANEVSDDDDDEDIAKFVDVITNNPEIYDRLRLAGASLRHHGVDPTNPKILRHIKELL